VSTRPPLATWIVILSIAFLALAYVTFTFMGLGG